MADLIDRGKLLPPMELQKEALRNIGANLMAQGYSNAMWEIQQAPTVDAVEVIRCKDCLFWTALDSKDLDEGGVCDVGEDRCITNPNGYCYWAKECINIAADRR